MIKSENSKIILGIDPGIANTGYACLLSKEGTFRVLKVGVFITKKGYTPSRIKKVYDFFTELVIQFEPDCISMERLFFAKNVKTALLVEEVRGALMLLSAQQSIDLFQYTPLQIKKTLTSYGQASKLEVKMVAQQLVRCDLPKSDDACDAVAAAICHAYNEDLGDIYD
ncbi:MAG: crossover junction endodeoxyribonuclease RuvC [Caldisericia bacterium]|nr:crossover junction endodeoxyribonuclease RuvC [Caldisericia bacterium]